MVGTHNSASKQISCTLGGDRSVFVERRICSADTFILVGIDAQKMKSICSADTLTTNIGKG